MQAQNFQFGLSLQPALTNNLIHNDGTVPKAVEDLYKSIESKTFGYSGYLFSQYKLSLKADLRIGAGYSKTGYVTNRVKLIYAQPEPSAPESIVFAYSHHDIIIPILFKYNLTRLKNTFYVIGGLTPQIKLTRSKTITMKYADG